MVKLPKKFSVGERVFAKVRGYPPWPAKIQNVTDPNTKNAKYHVVFFGTKEIGTCKIEDLFQYADNKDKFTKTVKRKYFHEGIQELEDDLKKNPNPVSVTSSKDTESAENIPENAVENVYEKGETIISGAVANEEANSGSLIIDEGDKKKAAKRKSQNVQSTPDVSEAKKKRGRKSTAAVLAENTSKQDSAHESQDEDAEKKVVSRSGRKIKPKRFHDSYSDAEVSADSTRNDQSIRSRTKSKTEESNENQESPVAPIKKRISIEKDEGKKAIVKDEIEAQNQLRLKILRTESQILFLDTQIRSSLGLDQANADECLEAMDQVLALQPLTALMLKKHPQIVETIKRLRRYVGNLPDWTLSEEETTIFKQKAEEIQKKAEIIYKRFKSLFVIPEGQTFWKTFTEHMEQFKQYTKGMTQGDIFSFLDDPCPELITPSTSAEESKSEITIPVKTDEIPEASTSSKPDPVIEPENK